MERNIQLRAEERGYKAVLSALCLWTLFNLYKALANRTKVEMLPCLLLCLAVCVQVFSEIAMKQKMTAGDEEYKEPDRLGHSVILVIVISAAVLTLGAWLFIKA